MRCFIAIDIDREAMEKIADLQQQLKEHADIKKGDVKWVQPERIHLTLKFLGEIKDRQVVEVCDAVKTVAAKHKRFNFAPKTVGTFGGKAARVIWVGIESQDDALEKLQSDLETELEAAGFVREERNFSGHLTICRVRSTKAGMKLAKLCQEYSDFSAGSLSADAMVVYQSQLTPKGPIYTVLAKKNLL